MIRERHSGETTSEHDDENGFVADELHMPNEFFEPKRPLKNQPKAIEEEQQRLTGVKEKSKDDVPNFDKKIINAIVQSLSSLRPSHDQSTKYLRGTLGPREVSISYDMVPICSAKS